jgi:hypothetical protein
MAEHIIPKLDKLFSFLVLPALFGFFAELRAHRISHLRLGTVFY